MSDYRRRVAMMEEKYRPPACPQCFNFPVRVVTMDAHDGLISESMPADGCPGCGAQIVRTLHIICDDAPGDEVHSYG